MKSHPFWADTARVVAVLSSLAVLTGCSGGGGGGSNGVESGSTAKTWHTAALIETDDAGDASRPRIVMDIAGNALAVWCQDDGTRYNIWANRYTAGVGWGTAELIETDNADGAYDPEIAMDASGNAMAVWQQSDGVRNNIWVNRYTAGAGWGTAELIEVNTGGAYDPRIAMSANGDAMAVWFQYDGMILSIWANHYTAGAGWGTAELIETDNAGSAYWPDVAMDANGNALAAWQQNDGTRDNSLANRYTAGVGWGTAELIETDNTGNTNPPEIAFDADGNAIAVWSQWDGTQFSIWANRYTAGVGWGTAGLIETDDAGGAGSPQIVFDTNGNALAVWGQSDGARNNVWSNRYTAGVGWGTAELIETDDAGDAMPPRITMNADGNAWAVWSQSDGTRLNIVANHYTTGTGWGTAGFIETDDAGAMLPDIAMDANGNACAVWAQSDGARYNIWANCFN